MVDDPPVYLSAASLAAKVAYQIILSQPASPRPRDDWRKFLMKVVFKTLKYLLGGGTKQN